ncbi:hypothetical protein ThrDRAFT_03674 [Frankia casuarinae]|uniref:Uncharacterized protein n=1 Tax=Frankia casuarinae (strain DSM 45818 / CECT 9043 / HFP020203 / CcI3) TaxID=106370 RepID=Q2JCA3_FRACC|nr:MULTISPECIES: hypothetical protein [Frankia]ABD11089.1 hypothetical protein Francci3_1713 [Frankia casuarinae]EYT90678.1 hypothetical protein ThrDRAFT_03674 [Frankia casuarinae]OFB39748.1 hypothetical protein Manayef4_20200 [Frankia sp. CgIM4]
MAPEFALPLTFVGCPVVAGIYVPRAGHYVPLWAVVAVSAEPGEFHVGLVRDDQNSIQSWYDIPGLTEALDWMRVKADFWADSRDY